MFAGILRCFLSQRLGHVVFVRAQSGETEVLAGEFLKDVWKWSPTAVVRERAWVTGRIEKLARFVAAPVELARRFTVSPKTYLPD